MPQAYHGHNFWSDNYILSGVWLVVDLRMYPN